jgi:hypothetical protein
LRALLHLAGAADLYEIPITFSGRPSRIPMAATTSSQFRAAEILAHLRFKSRLQIPDRHLLQGYRIFVRRIPMMDVVMMALGFVFFALSIGYVFACDRL